MLDKTDIIPSSVLEIEVGETEQIQKRSTVKQTAKQHLHPINQIPFLTISHRQCESVSQLVKKFQLRYSFSIQVSNPQFHNLILANSFFVFSLCRSSQVMFFFILGLAATFSFYLFLELIQFIFLIRYRRFCFVLPIFVPVPVIVG